MCIALHSTFHSKDKMHGNCNDFGKQHGWVKSTFAIDKFWLNQFSNSLFRRWFFLDQQTQTEMNCKQNVREKRRRERSEQWLFALAMSSSSTSRRFSSVQNNWLFCCLCASFALLWIAIQLRKLATQNPTQEQFESKMFHSPAFLCPCCRLGILINRLMKPMFVQSVLILV